MEIEVIPLHPAKAPFPMDSMLRVNDSDVNPTHPLNALAPIDWVLDKLKEVMAEQPSNDDSPIVLLVLIVERMLNLESPKKHSFP